MPASTGEDAPGGFDPAPPEVVLRGVAAFLRSPTPHRRAVDDTDAWVLFDLAGTEGLLGLVVACLDAGLLELPEPVVARVEEDHEQAMRWCMQVEQRLLDVEEWFSDGGGIEHLVLKGPAVAHLDEVDPTLRSFADLDLLVAGPDMDRAIEVLVAHGVGRRITERRPGFDRRFVKGVGMTCADGVEIDVHRSLCGGAHGFRIPLDRIFAEAETFELGGRAVAAPSQRHRALHACYHAVVGSPVPPLRTLRDIAGYLTTGDLPPDVLVSEARVWRGEAVLAEAVRATLDTFELDAAEWRRWVDGVVVDPAEARIIEEAQQGSDRLFEWTTVRELGWPDRVAFLRAVAFPSRESLAERGLSPWQRVTSGLRRVADRRRCR